MVYKELSANDIEREFAAIGRGGRFSPNGYAVLYDILDGLSGDEGFRFNAFDVSLMFREVDAAGMVRDYPHYLDEKELLSEDGEPLDEEEVASLIADAMSDVVVVRGFSAGDAGVRYIVDRSA